SSRRRNTRLSRDWSSDVCSSDLEMLSDEDKFQRENISTAAGRILENMLDYLTFLFSSKLPRKPKGDYQLHELLTGLSSQLVKLLKVEHLSKDEQGKYSVVVNSVELQPIIDT